MAFSFRSIGRKQDRRGSALILTALALLPLIALLALVVDWGRICVTKAELQRAADASAMAGAAELQKAQAPGSKLSPLAAEAAARRAAMEYAALNTASGTPLELKNADIEVGYLANPLQPGAKLDTSKPEFFNAVRVHMRRDAGSNGAIPMYFARVFGKHHADCRASATAAFIANVKGFLKPIADDGPHLPMLPFTLDQETWQAAVNGYGPDEWKWDADAGEFVPGSDGIPEVNLYPQRTHRGDDDDGDDDDDGRGRSGRRSHPTSSAANRGSVNIGTSTYNMLHIARQILYGISLQDWEFHNGGLSFDENGELLLDGKPGIAGAFQLHLQRIVGHGRIVPIYSSAQRHKGEDTATYTIVEWAGMHIAEVDLIGGQKRFIAQAGEVIVTGTVPEPNPIRRSRYIFSRVWLAQ